VPGSLLVRVWQYVVYLRKEGDRTGSVRLREQAGGIARAYGVLKLILRPGEPPMKKMTARETMDMMSGERMSMLSGDLNKGLRFNLGKEAPETCDHGGSEASPAEGRKLMRCVKCKVAWCCSPSCQKTAWREGHKADCFEAVSTSKSR